MIIGKENTIINSIIKDHLDSFYCKEIFHLSAENSIQTFSDKKFKKIEMKHLEQLRNELFHSVYFFDEIEPNEKSFNEGTFVSKIEQMESVLKYFDSKNTNHLIYYSLRSDKNNLFFKYTDAVENIFKNLNFSRISIFRRNFPSNSELFLRKTLNQQIQNIEPEKLAKAMKINSEYERKGLEIFEESDIEELIKITKIKN
jgi:hypothetical protein